MGKGKRNKQQHTRADVLAKREAMERILKASQLTFKEQLIWNWHFYTCRLKVQHISRKVYDLFLTQEKKWFRKMAYTNYADGKLWGSFSDFHGLMSTK